jgi:thiol-disulfide isomerase/thioredoxin
MDGEGRSLTLADFRGRIVLLNLWATWCTPCREEMPTLDRLQARLGGTDFEVVALSIDHDGIAAVRKFYQEIGIKHLRIYNDPTTDATARLGVIGIPATLLIDREGREVGRALGPAEWDAPEVVETVRKHLNDPRKP